MEMLRPLLDSKSEIFEMDGEGMHVLNPFSSFMSC